MGIIYNVVQAVVNLPTRVAETIVGVHDYLRTHPRAAAVTGVTAVTGLSVAAAALLGITVTPALFVMTGLYSLGIYAYVVKAAQNYIAPSQNNNNVVSFPSFHTPVNRRPPVYIQPPRVVPQARRVVQNNNQNDWPDFDAVIAASMNTSFHPAPYTPYRANTNTQNNVAIDLTANSTAMTLKQRVERLCKIDNKFDGVLGDKGYHDPITLEFMDDPVTLSDDQTYARTTAQNLFNRNAKSPINRARLDKRVMRTNTVMLKEVEALVEEKEYGIGKPVAANVVSR